jgi:hypothetical protein
MTYLRHGGFALVLMLGACADSGPQEIGKDTYLESVRVPLSGQTGAKQEALETATQHCSSLGKKLLLDHITSGECALHGGCGEAEIIYLCLNENDPRFQSPRMRKEPDIAIQGN